MFLSTLRHRIGLDRAIAYTILARGWSSSAGLITVSLIAHYLSPAEQGYYYTFWSLVALQIIFELGFSFVILQLASHERAHLSISGDFIITGDDVAHARLASILQKAILWYSLAAVLVGAFLVPAGLYFFSTHRHSGTEVHWRFPWCCVALLAALAFQMDPIISFLEGCGYVAKIAQLRLAQAVLGSGLAWLALVTHHGLFAPALIIMGQASAAIYWLARRRRMLYALLTHNTGAHRIGWRKEVWPFQWRIAVSWLSGYFFFQVFNPILFAAKGPVAAGQMGMSLSIASAVSAVSISWITTKAAPLGAMIARKEFLAMDEMFFRALRQSVAVCGIGVLCIWLAIYILKCENIPFATRLLKPYPMAALLLTVLVNHIWFSEAIYLRAHKQETFLPISVTTGLLIGGSAYILAPLYGATGMVTAYFTVSTVVGLGFGTRLFLKYRRLWHA
ncbi:MAG TPA: hypothetical protein VGD64_13155 [Acidisarcina sp.]